MQESQYSVYDATFQANLEYIGQYCGQPVTTAILPPLIPPTVPPTPFCVSNTTYTTAVGDTCDSISLAESVASAALYKGNSALTNCSNITAGETLCLPLSCQTTYLLQSNDTCVSINVAQNLTGSTIQSYNPWINYDCSNLQQASTVYGHVLCLSPQGGTYTPNSTISGYNPNPYTSSLYADSIFLPPINTTVAPNTTSNCGGWYVAAPADTCASVALGNAVTYSLFLAINPSLQSGNCTAGLVTDLAYCVHPTWAWNTTGLAEVYGSGSSGSATTVTASTSSTSSVSTGTI
jgi:hypothetical protein